MRSTVSEAWDENEVKVWFETLSFPTEGIVHGSVNGETLTELFGGLNARDIFTASPPDGIGLSILQFQGRFTLEMRKKLQHVAR